MSEKRTCRGRPKGSGIDDRKRLAAIARLIASDPELKPTTAIRNLGISDPSIIRRLRDKFNSARAELMKDLAAASATEATVARSTAEDCPPTTPTNPPKEDASLARPRRISQPEPARRAPAAVMAASANTPKIRSEHMKNDTAGASRTVRGKSAGRQPKAASSKTSPKPVRHAAREDDSERLPAHAYKPIEPTDLISSMLRASVTATSTFWVAQTALANQFARSPYITLALRQQLALSEWAIGMVPVFQNLNKTAT